MTIKQQIDAIFNHPFFRVAMENYQEGNDADLRQLFFEVQFHVYEKCNLNACRTYGLKRWLNTCDIKKEIKGTPPPENLDLILPIPEKKPLQNTGKFEKRKPTVRIRQFTIPNQLNLFIQIAYTYGKETDTKKNRYDSTQRGSNPIHTHQESQPTGIAIPQRADFS